MELSINRTGLLLRKQWAENRQLYILGLLVTAGVMSVFLLMMMRDMWGLDYSSQRAAMYLGMLGAGAIFSSTLLSQFGEKVKAIGALSLPASALEKLVTALFFTFIIFPLSYLIVIYPVVIVMHYIDVEVVGHINDLYDLKPGANGVNMLAGFVALQTVVLLCSVVFRRYIFFKTAVLVMILVYGGVMLNMQIGTRMFGDKAQPAMNATVRYVAYNNGSASADKLLTRKVTPKISGFMPYSPAYVIDETNPFLPDYSLSLALTGASGILFTLLFYAVIGFLWLITWFRIKETVL